MHKIAEQLVEALVALALLLMMVITVLDVIGRYVINRPLPGATELVQYSMVTAIFIALPLITARREHISVSLIDGLFGERGRRWHRAVIAAISAIVLVLVSWKLWGHAQMLATNRDVIGFLSLPVAPAAFVASTLAGLTVLVLVAMVVSDLGGKQTAASASRGGRPAGTSAPRE